MNGATLPRVRLLVCGNVDRGDDGAAIWAVSHILPGAATDDLPGVDVRRCGQLEIEDLVDGAADVRLLIIDTAVGIHAGRVVTLTFDELLAQTTRVAPRSSHSLPIDQVIGVARQLSGAPVDGLFVGIGAADVSLGRSLSRSVREGMGEFVVAIEKALMRLISVSESTAGRT